MRALDFETIFVDDYPTPSEHSGPILYFVSEIFHTAKVAAFWHGHVCAGRNHSCYLLPNSICYSNDSVSWYGARQRLEIR